VNGDSFAELVPRTGVAGTARQVALGASSRRGRPVGWWGMIMLVASEAMLFGCLLATYAYLRLETDRWPPAGTPRPAVAVPVTLALVLAASTVPMHLAARSAGTGNLPAARLLVLAALVVQAGYFAYQVHDFERQLGELTPQANAYGSIYFVLLGADHGHVAVGLLLNAWLLLKLACGLTTYRLDALRAIAVYWYAVALLTLIVTGTLVSPSL
jgi:heme/copper-type cytochrome/quinol oxidase subunit 3